MVKVSASELKAEIESGDVKLLDVRTGAEFESEHIAGSVLMPLGQLRPEEVKGSPWVVVCLGGIRAAKACAELEAGGCENLRVLDGGLTAWKSAGNATVKGEREVIPIERQGRIVAGSLVLTGVILSVAVAQPWIWLSAFAGAGLVFAGLTGACPMGILLLRAPWNRGSWQVCPGGSCSVSEKS